MVFALKNQSRSIDFVHALLMACVLMTACSQKKESGAASGGGETYYHPSVATAPAGTTTSASKSIAKDLSLTADVVLQLGSNKVTIPAGAVHQLGTASLQSYTGPFVNSSGMRMVTESMMLVIRKVDATDFSRTEIFKDIVIEQTSTTKTSATKMVQLFLEDAELSTAAKTGMTQKTILSTYTDLGNSQYKVTSKIRHPRMGFVVAEATSGVLPSGFGTFIEPARDPSTLSGTATTPADVTLNWTGDPRYNTGYGVVYYAAGSTELDCTAKSIVTATTTDTIVSTTASATYTYSISSLLDGTSYTFKVCGLSSRSTPDASAGSTVVVTTPARAHAVLTNAPNDPSNTSALNVTVGGTGVVQYQYALVANQTSCSGATFSAWTAVATPITDAIPATSGTMILCVLGKIDSTNVQLVSTDVLWTVDKTPPTFTSLALVSPALDGYLSSADRLLTTVIAGTLTATEHDATLNAYKVVTSATTCNGALTYGSAPAANTSSVTVDGVYKICARIADQAGNVAYGASSTFTVDTTISFTAMALANQAVDTYINLAENSLTGNLVSTPTGTGFSTARYALVSSSTTCNVSVTYVASIPRSNNAGFTTDGDYKVCTDLSDAAGNHAYGASATIHLKKAVPTYTSIALANAAADGYINATDHALTTTLSTTATGSNYDTLQYGIQVTATACSALGTWNSSLPQADSANLAVDGSTYKVCAKFTDNAGNPAAYGNTADIVYDITAPVFSTLALDNGATDGYLSSADMTAGLAVTTASSSTGSSSEKYALVASGTTCNGSLSYSSSLIPSNDSGFATDTTYKVCVQLTDLAGNLAYGESATITRVTTVPDCTAISLANDVTDNWLNIAESSTSNTLSSSSSTTLASPIKTYAIIASAGSCDNSATFGAQDVIPASNSAGLSDGSSYKVCAKVTDIAGNTPAYCATAAFTVDLTAPVFTSLPLANEATDTYVNIAEHANVAATAVAGPLTSSGSASDGFVIAASTTTCDGSLTYSASIPLAKDTVLASSGTYKVCVKLADTAGNAVYNESPTFTSDQIAPTFTSFDLANEVNDGYINIADAASGLDAANNLVAGGQVTTEYAAVASASACSSGTYGASIPTISAVAALGEASYKICAHFVDVAGNETYGSTSTIVVDVTAPSFTSIALANDATDTYINATEHGTSNALAAAAAGSGHSVTEYALVSSATVCSSVVVWSVSIPADNSASFTTDGDYIVCVKMTDYANNPASYGSSAIIHLKTDYPIFTSVDLANEVTDLYLNANDHTLANALLTNLSGSGYATDKYAIVTSGTTCNASLTYGAAKLENDSAFNAANTFKVCVALTDVAGNITYGASATFDYDPTAPTFTSLALANDAVDSWLNATEHALTNDLAGSLTGSGYTAATYVVATSATTCDGALTYGAMAKSNDAAITDAGTWKVCVRLVDAAGNFTYGGTTATFQSKYTLPTFTSMALNGATGDSYVNSADVTGATDLVSAAVASNQNTTAYAVTLNSNACDGALTYSATIPKTNNASLSSDGLYKVCAKLTDTAGNVPGYGGSASFRLDTTKPASTVTTSGTILPSTTAGSNTTIAGTASDGGAGVASVSISIQEGSAGCYSSTSDDFSATCPNWLAATGTTSWSYDIPDHVLLKGAVYSIQSRATDLAVSGGNVETAFGTGSFTYSANEGDELWPNPVTYDGGTSDDKPTAAALDTSGNIFVVGYHTASDKNWMIKKFDTRGNEDTTHWNKDVGDVGSDEVARGVAVDTSNNVYVVGSRNNGSNLDWWLKKYSSTGTEDLVNWDVILDGGVGDDEAMAAATDSSGNLYIVGYGTNLTGIASGKDAWVRKYTSAGVLGCEQKIDGGANLDDAALAVAVNSSTGKFYVAGYQTVAGPDQQMVLRRLRTSDCTIEMTVSGNSAGTSDVASSVRIDSAGNVYIAGRNSGTDSDWWIRKYSAALIQQTDFSPAVAGNHEALALGIDASNNIFAGGYKTGATQDWWLRKFSNALVEDTSHWDKVLDGNSGADQITAIVIGTGTNDVGSVYAIGWGTNVVSGSSGADWWVRKFAGP